MQRLTKNGKRILSKQDTFSPQTLGRTPALLDPLDQRANVLSTRIRDYSPYCIWYIRPRGRSRLSGCKLSLRKFREDQIVSPANRSKYLLHLSPHSPVTLGYSFPSNRQKWRDRSRPVCERCLASGLERLAYGSNEERIEDGSSRARVRPEATSERGNSSRTDLESILSRPVGSISYTPTQPQVRWIQIIVLDASKYSH